MRALLIAALLTSLAFAGCMGTDTGIRIPAGKAEVWQSDMKLVGPLLIEKGASLVSAHVIETPGPIFVEGEFVSTGAIRFTGSDHPIIFVRGGKVILDSAHVEGAAVLVVEDGDVILDDTVMPLRALEATAASIRMTNSSIAHERDQLLTQLIDSNLSALNSTFGDVRFDTDHSTEVRIINSGVPMDRFVGGGRVAQGWTILLRPHTVDGTVFPHETLLVSDVGKNEPALMVQTGLDGRAYVEVIDFRASDGQVDLRPIHAVQVPARHGIASFVASARDQQVDILVAG